MAENPIGKDDIIKGDEITKTLREIIDLLDKGLVGAMKNVSKQAVDMQAAVSKANVATEEGKKTVSEAGEATAKLAAEQKQLSQISQALEKEKVRMSLLEKESVQDKIKETAELKKGNTQKQKDITQGKAAADSYSRMAQELGKLRAAWRLASDEGRTKMTPQIQKLDSELKKLDKSVGQHQRNVGNYGSAIMGMGKQLLSAAGIMGGVTMAVKAFKSILDSTQASGDSFRAFIGGVGEGAKFFAQRIATVGFSNLISGFRDAFLEGKRYADMLDLIGDLQRALGLQIIDIDTEIARQRVIAKDRSRDLQEREAAVDEIINLEKKKLNETQRLAELALDNEIKNIQVRVDINKESIIDFIANHEKYLTQITEGATIEEKLRRDAVVAIKEQVFNAQTEQMMEVETRKFSQLKYDELFANMSEEERQMVRIAELNNLVVDTQRDKLVAAIGASKNALKAQVQSEETLIRIRNGLYNELIKQEEKLTAKTDKEAEERLKIATASIEARHKKENEFILGLGKDELKKNEVVVSDAKLKADELVAIEVQRIERTKEALDAEAAYRKELDKEVIKDRYAAAQESLEILSGATEAISNVFMAQKQRELNAAGDNAKKREEIEREYFKKEKALSIAQAVINGAQAVTKVQAQTGILSPFMIPLIIATTLSQIALIASQKFAEGGFTGKGGQRDETGERIAGIVHEDEFVINKKNTRKYRPLIEAIHDDDPQKIVQLVENGHMHELWGSMNYAMRTVHKQDPYTRMMYELLKENPITYVDSNGNTVIKQGGRTKIIKR